MQLEAPAFRFGMKTANVPAHAPTFSQTPAPARAQPLARVFVLACARVLAPLPPPAQAFAPALAPAFAPVFAGTFFARFCSDPAPALAPTLWQALAPGLARALAQTSELAVAVAVN